MEIAGGSITPVPKTRPRCGKSSRDLIEAGIRRVINLQEENERDYGGDLFVPYAVELQGDCQRAERRSNDAADADLRYGRAIHAVQMRAILDEIDQAIAQNRPVDVHCWGGKGRGREPSWGAIWRGMDWQAIGTRSEESRVCAWVSQIGDPNLRSLPSSSKWSRSWQTGE